MFWFRKKEKLKETKHKVCECGFPFPPNLLTYRCSPIRHERVIVQHKDACLKCGKENTWNA